MKTLLLSLFVASLATTGALAQTPVYHSKAPANLNLHNAAAPTGAAFNGTRHNTKITQSVAEAAPVTVTPRTTACSKHAAMTEANCSMHCGV